jgi:hypothetical protein
MYTFVRLLPSTHEGCAASWLSIRQVGECYTHGRKGDGWHTILGLPVGGQQLNQDCAIHIEGVRLHHRLAKLLWRQHLWHVAASQLPVVSIHPLS